MSSYKFRNVCAIVYAACLESYSLVVIIRAHYCVLTWFTAVGQWPISVYFSLSREHLFSKALKLHLPSLLRGRHSYHLLYINLRNACHFQDGRESCEVGSVERMGHLREIYCRFIFGKLCWIFRVSAIPISNGKYSTHCQAKYKKLAFIQNNKINI